MEEPKNTRWKRTLLFLKKKFRFVVLNDSTFAEKFSFRLTPWGIIISIAALTILMTSLVISLIAFTPLREYIPGYGNIAERKQILTLNLKADSIEQTLSSREAYLKSVLNALDERLETKTERPKKDTTGKYQNVNTKPSSKDMEFRNDYEQGRDNVVVNVTNGRNKSLADLVFFTPVKGIITSSFAIPEEHFGVDIVTKQDETVKCTLDGTIIYAGFSAKDGNIVQVQHNDNLVSVYKHCSTFLRNTGDRIKSGDAIAVVGNTGEKSNGPHLHFELWFNGAPVNPQEFVSF